MITKSEVLAFLLAVLMGGCAGEEKEAKGPSAGAAGDLGGGGSKGAASDAKGAAGGRESVAADEDGDGGGSAKLTGQQFFEQKVDPVFRKECIECHAEPRFTVTVRAPLTIRDYPAMRALLANGATATRNDLYAKVRGRSAHTGGDRCADAATLSPACRVLFDWWVNEFGADRAGAEESVGGDEVGDEAGSGDMVGEGGGMIGGIRGAIEIVTARGIVNGWAGDGDMPAQALRVSLVVDGVLGSGTIVKTMNADRVGYDGNLSGNHAFDFEMSDALKDGKRHQLSLYVGDAGEEQLLSETPYEFVSFNQTTAGRDYYNNTLRPQLSVCQGCHGAPTYDLHYGALITPGPIKFGGTARDNSLINYASGGNGHPGGNFCGGGKDAGLCAQFQAWWRLEFER